MAFRAPANMRGARFAIAGPRVLPDEVQKRHPRRQHPPPVYRLASGHGPEDRLQGGRSGIPVLSASPCTAEVDPCGPDSPRLNVDNDIAATWRSALVCCQERLSAPIIKSRTEPAGGRSCWAKRVGCWNLLFRTVLPHGPGWLDSSQSLAGLKQIFSLRRTIAQR